MEGQRPPRQLPDSTMELDANVGKVWTIREAGIEKDTIVVFTSDNGPWLDAWPDAGYTPFRGMKGTGSERRWRMASVMWAPGASKAGNGPQRHDVAHGHLADDRCDGGPHPAAEPRAEG